ncbi:MAG: 6-bladed beta-propeller [Candidatus Omnitrophica bacterium]|nr:6-bladed beta-propeller [Candidatus Omnitrophota bacterium]
MGIGAGTKKRLLGFLSAGICLGICGWSGAQGSPLFWPPPPEDIRVVFVKSISSPKDIGVEPSIFKKLKHLIVGSQEDILVRPISLAVGREGSLYVCDPGAPALHVFDQQAKRYKKISSIGDEALVSPVGVAVHSSGAVFVSDSKLNKVFGTDKNGRTARTIGREGFFSRPTGLAVDEERLYVVDTAAHRVQVFDLKGDLIGGFGQRGNGDGEFNYPTSVALDQEGRIYVVDTLNFRIQVFDKNYGYLYQIGRAGDASGSFSRPKGVAVDSYGHIYSTDGLFDNVQIFGQGREFLLSLGESGDGNGEFWIISGIAIDGSDTIYVADSYNQRLQVFRYVGAE